MELQYGLFDDLPNAPRPVEQPGAGVANRNANYHESKPRHSGQRALVLRHIANMHNIGATREEIADALSKRFMATITSKTQTIF